MRHHGARRRPSRMSRSTPESEIRQVMLVYAGGDVSFAPYFNDSVGFAHKVLGVKLTLEQEEIMRAMVASDRVTVRSGRRIGKSFIAACIALWFICTRGSRAMVVITAPKLGQVQDIIWPALTHLYRNAKIPLGGKLAHLAATGLRFESGKFCK